LRLGVKVIEDHIAYFATAKLDNHAQTVFIGLIAQLSNTFDLLLFNQLGNPLEQTRLVQLVRNLMDDDCVLAFSFVSDNFGFSSDVDTSATCAVGLNNAGAPSNDGARWEVWSWDISDQVIDFQLGVLE